MEPDTLPAPLAAALVAAGYRVGGPAGVGAGGPAWTVTRVAPGDDDAPRRLVAQVVVLPDDDARARLTRRLEALGELANPHLPEVVDVVVVPSETADVGAAGGAEIWAVLLAEVPGATVGALLAARGRLSPGEVVTLAVPVAGALDALHRAGWVHGDVSPANLVVRPDGRPVLIDMLGQSSARGSGPRWGPRAGPVASATGRGTPGFVAPEVREGSVGGTGAVGADGLPAGAPADVYALAAVALAALDLGAHDGRVGAELRAACAADPVRRPTAAELAAALYACADPEPITQPDAGVLARAELAQLAAPSRTVSAPEGARHRAGGRRGALRRRLGVAAAAAVLVTGGTGWAVLGQGSPAPRGSVAPGTEAGPARAPERAEDLATPSPGASAPAAAPGGHGAAPVQATTRPEGRSTDPAEAAAALTRLRAEVLAGGDPARLTEVVLPGSPAHRADVALVDRLTAEGVELEGLAAVVEDAVVETAAGAGEQARTTVDVRVQSYVTAHVRRSPSGAAAVAAQPPQAVSLRLVWTEDGWRVGEVRPG